MEHLAGRGMRRGLESGSGQGFGQGRLGLGLDSGGPGLGLWVGRLADHRAILPIARVDELWRLRQQQLQALRTPCRGAQVGGAGAVRFASSVERSGPRPGQQAHALAVRPPLPVGAAEEQRRASRAGPRVLRLRRPLDK